MGVSHGVSTLTLSYYQYGRLCRNRRILLSIPVETLVIEHLKTKVYSPQKGLFEFRKANGVHVTAFGPLGCTPFPVLIGRRGPGPLEDSVIGKLSTEYSKTPAQLILCFMINRCVSVIPKSNNLKRTGENFDCLFDIDPADFTIIDNLMGERGERGSRNLETRDYLGLDNFNEVVEEPEGQVLANSPLPIAIRL